MKTAIVYDRVNKWGGAESVLLALHEIFPDAPLYTSVYDKNKAPWAEVFSRIIPSFLQKIPVLRNYHELLGWLTPIAYETFSFDEYDLVISVTSEAVKGIITKPQTLHICYCLTPTRYLWSGYEEYLNNPPTSLNWIPFYKYISQPFLRYTKYWDYMAAQRPDVMVGISTSVQKRIKKYYQRDSELIFPPVDIDKFRIANKKQITKDKNKDYYLYVGRLVPYKKVGLAVEAFNDLRLPLVIIGTGSEESKLKSMANKNIIFKGFVAETELPQYFREAKAFIYPQEEDFGITAVEAQAAGCPLIAYRAGGALDTVVDPSTGPGRFATGIFFNEQTKESLIEAIKYFDDLNHRSIQPQNCVKNAAKFSKDIFKKKFQLMLEKTKVANKH